MNLDLIFKLHWWICYQLMDTSLFDHFKTHYSAHRWDFVLNGFNECCQAVAAVDIHSFGCQPFFIFACSLFFFNMFFFPFFRTESPWDVAAFCCTARALSGCKLLAAAVWSQRSTATGQQRRPHPIRHRSSARTWAPPPATQKVSNESLKSAFILQSQ